jgi:hypothetical protein
VRLPYPPAALFLGRVVLAMHSVRPRLPAATIKGHYDGLTAGTAAHLLIATVNVERARAGGGRRSR